MPWHFGYGGIATGAIANDLSALIEDPNSRIHEGKAFTCNLRKAWPATTERSRMSVTAAATAPPDGRHARAPWGS